MPWRHIRGHQRTGLECGGGRDVHDPSVARVDHAGQISARKRDQRIHIQVHHVEIVRDRKLRERPVESITGVVDQHTGPSALNFVQVSGSERSLAMTFTPMRWAERN